ncbi:hypothetical protein MFRU_006g01650 [Monilinia fructicola]|nr:hypothetical protein MFRU_006g01650 [Monilinia fructicola]
MMDMAALESRLSICIYTINKYSKRTPPKAIHQNINAYLHASLPRSFDHLHLHTQLQSHITFAIGTSLTHTSGLRRSHRRSIWYTLHDIV